MVGYICTASEGDPIKLEDKELAGTSFQPNMDLPLLFNNNNNTTVSHHIQTHAGTPAQRYKPSSLTAGAPSSPSGKTHSSRATTTVKAKAKKWAPPKPLWHQLALRAPEPEPELAPRVNPRSESRRARPLAAS